MKGGEYFLLIGYWGCAAGWGHIFTIGLNIIGHDCIFNIGTRMGSPPGIWGSGVRKLWQEGIEKWKICGKKGVSFSQKDDSWPQNSQAFHP